MINSVIFLNTEKFINIDNGENTFAIVQKFLRMKDEFMIVISINCIMIFENRLKYLNK